MLHGIAPIYFPKKIIKDKQLKICLIFFKIQ
jgi:hypothetical protein